MTIHKLKLLPEYYKAVECGEKTFEVRKNDRDFKVGDILCLTYYDPDGKFSGGSIFKEVTYILYGGQFGVEEGYCVMGIKDAANINFEI